MNYWKIKQKIKSALEKLPALFIFILKIKNYNNSFLQRIISSDTDVVIEGFPRCSNSFAVQAFKRSQEKKYKIATHTHSFAQIIEAVKLNKPTLVLIRKPNECIVSLKALELESHNGSSKIMEQMEISVFIEKYIAFYTSIYKIKDKFVIGKFEDVTSNFGGLINKLNEKYNTSFNSFVHTKESEKEIFNSTGFHLSPSLKRDEYKKLVESEYYSSNNAALRKKAEEVYERFVNS